jgi:hypothetical protein
MAICSVIGCTQWASGGFREVLSPGSFENPHAEILGIPTFWCDEHKESLSQGLGQGDYLSEDDVREL